MPEIHKRERNMNNLAKKISILDIQKYGIDFSSATHEEVTNTLEAANDEYIEVKAKQQEENITEHADLLKEENFSPEDYLKMLKIIFKDNDIVFNFKRTNSTNNDVVDDCESERPKRIMTPSAIVQINNKVHIIKNRGRLKEHWLDKTDEYKEKYRVTHARKTESTIDVWCENSGIDRPDWISNETKVEIESFITSILK
jgi:hypothetical protein